MRIKQRIYLAIVTIALTGCKQQKAPVAEIVNKAASIPASTLPMNPLAWKPVTSFANRKEGTMATLYGNDDAITAARAGSAYNRNAVLALVTWSTKEDPHWFGGNIPSNPTRVEFAQAQPTGPDSITWAYSRYEGTPLAKVSITPDIAPQRTTWLATQKAAVMP